MQVCLECADSVFRSPLQTVPAHNLLVVTFPHDAREATDGRGVGSIVQDRSPAAPCGLPANTRAQLWCTPVPTMRDEGSRDLWCPLDGSMRVLHT